MTRKPKIKFEGTKTGRFQSKVPNQTTLPRDNTFVEDKNWYLVEADYFPADIEDPVRMKVTKLKGKK